MVNKELQKARQDWFLEEIESLNIDNIQVDIANKTGYKKQTVSLYGYLYTKRHNGNTYLLQAVRGGIFTIFSLL